MQCEKIEAVCLFCFSELCQSNAIDILHLCVVTDMPREAPHHTAIYCVVRRGGRTSSVRRIGSGGIGAFGVSAFAVRVPGADGKGVLTLGDIA